MNILILTTHLNPGGLSRYVLSLSRGLKQRGHQVWVGCSGGDWVEKLKAAGIGYQYLPINTKSIASLKILVSLFRLRPFLCRETIAIVHANTRVTQFLALLIYRFLKIPYAATFHGFYGGRFFRKLFKFSGLKTIAISHAVKTYLVNTLGFTANNIRVVYNGLDESEFTARTDRRSDWGFKPADYLIGILGRVSEEKGHFLAAAAVKIIVEQYPQVRFLIAGEGKMKQSLTAYLSSAGLEAYARFIDCPASEFLDTIDLLLVPSRKEGFGYSIVEAFTKGVPVIGYNTGGIAEIIRDKINGWLFYAYTPPALADKIAEVILNPNTAKQLASEARQDARQFSAARMAAETEAVYREVLNDG